MKRSAPVKGLVSLFYCSLIFGFSTLVCCLISKSLMAFWKASPWESPNGQMALWILPLAATLCALIAVVSYGASGSHGADPAADLKDIVIRLFRRHLLWSIAFLAPQILMARDQQTSLVFIALSLLCLFPMIATFDHVSKSIIERSEEDNLGQFVRGVGSTGSTKQSKGIRRD